MIQHLAGPVGARVKVTIEIEAETPEGGSGLVVLTVTENACTLHFRTVWFEYLTWRGSACRRKAQPVQILITPD